MMYFLSQAQVFAKEKFEIADVLIKDGRIAAVGTSVPCPPEAVHLSLSSYFLFPGFQDVHVHLREPGFSYKETIETGTFAAAHGGYTGVCAMPNLDPPPDSAEHLRVQQRIIEKSAAVHVYPYGTITKGEKGETLSDMEALAPYVIAFSDDGKGLQSDDRMREAMQKAKTLCKIIAAHCEDERLLFGGYIHDGEYARQHGHAGISSESEWRQVERDLRLAAETGCAYHVCHVSTKESVALIRQAKAAGVDITCETAPHYLTLDETYLQEDGRFKMNPPLRSPADREALIEGVRDGTIDMIATDHAPHTPEEKSRGLKGSPMGVVGLETAFPVLYTELVMPGVLSLTQVLRCLTENPRRRFGIGTEIKVGERADLTAFDLNAAYRIDPQRFLSMGKSTPFAGKTVQGPCKLTMVNGRIVWQDNLTEKSC